MRFLSMIRGWLDVLDDSRIGDAIGVAFLIGGFWTWLLIGYAMSGGEQ